MTLLSDFAINRERAAGRVVIWPFEATSLGTNSYDVRLGAWYYRPAALANDQSEVDPWDEASTRRYWGDPQYAGPVGRYPHAIAIAAGQTILAHTIEIIGGRAGITTSMRAKSSIARVPLSVCKCAGLGDVGYIARWTMEITNHGDLAVVLPVGARIAQICFYDVGPTVQDYGAIGHYGSAVDRPWSAEDMLPKLWTDRDLPNLLSGLGVVPPC